MDNIVSRKEFDEIKEKVAQLEQLNKKDTLSELIKDVKKLVKIR